MCDRRCELHIICLSLIITGDCNTYNFMLVFMMYLSLYVQMCMWGHLWNFMKIDLWDIWARLCDNKCGCGIHLQLWLVMCDACWENGCMRLSPCEGPKWMKYEIFMFMRKYVVNLMFRWVYMLIRSWCCSFCVVRVGYTGLLCL